AAPIHIATHTYIIYIWAVADGHLPAALLTAWSIAIITGDDRSSVCNSYKFSMASTTASAFQALYSLSLGRSITSSRRRASGRVGFRVCAVSQGPNKRGRAPPGVDTRIHWDNQEEGWVGGATGTSWESTSSEDQQRNLLGEKFSDLINDSTDSHYQRLSKEYHPDTTALPLKAASEKFLRLREVYDVLSNDETRRFYDWTLAQEAASRQAEKLRMKLEDPYEQDLSNYEPVPDVVDRLGGKNMALSDQAMTALTIDIFILFVSIACIIIYFIFFKESYE
ncbi:hypothetical protein F8388_017575, partial [Cannabis sativa]